MSALAYLEERLENLSETNILKSIDKLKREQMKRATEEKERMRETNIALGQSVEDLF